MANFTLVVELNLVKFRQRFGFLPLGVEECDIYKNKR